MFLLHKLHHQPLHHCALRPDSQIDGNYFLSFQSIAGVSSFRHQKVGKKSELILLWAPEDLEEPPVEQVRNTWIAFKIIVI